MNMLEDDQAMSIVKICISLAKELNMESVAEGVATQEIWDELARLGCDTAQGYVITKPMPLAECLKWTADHQQKV
jgi:EAL domain-containing protein (putative c-di-GMP-specific phosphodiesterase class I)